MRLSPTAPLAVITHDGQRWWQYYCRDQEPTQAAIWNAIGVKGDFPIEVKMDADSEWALSESVADTDIAQ